MVLFNKNMYKHKRIEKKLCTKCLERNLHSGLIFPIREVKTRPRICLPEERYQSCHRLCKPCWKMERYKNWDSDEILQKKYLHCSLCNMQKCWICGNYGTWQEDLLKVLCWDCL